MAAKKQWYTEDGFSKSTHQNFRYLAEFYFYRILNYENFKMEVEQMNFVTHLVIFLKYNYIIDYLKTLLLKFGQISFKW